MVVAGSVLPGAVGASNGTRSATKGGLLRMGAARLRKWGGGKVDALVREYGVQADVDHGCSAVVGRGAKQGADASPEVDTVGTDTRQPNNRIARSS